MGDTEEPCSLRSKLVNELHTPTGAGTQPTLHNLELYTSLKCDKLPQQPAGGEVVGYRVPSWHEGPDRAQLWLSSLENVQADCLF